MATKCPACQLGLPAECYIRPGKGCKEPKPEVIKSEPSGKERDKGPGNRALKLAGDVKDAHSTGRKRAAVAYPLPGPGEPTLLCEWSGLSAAGGGEFPIIGCLPSAERKAVNRHHGPDKDTLNNAEGNVHRICAFCHNRWHAQNDNTYETYRTDHTYDGVFAPRLHDSETRATLEELLNNEMKWTLKK